MFIVFIHQNVFTYNLERILHCRKVNLPLKLLCGLLNGLSVGLKLRLGLENGLRNGLPLGLGLGVNDL